MSTPATEPSPPRLDLRRTAAPILTIVAAGAGLVAGSRLAAPQAGLGIVALLLVIAACVLAAWTLARPGPDPLSATGNDAVLQELDRARRHRRTFAMARLELVRPVDLPVDRSSRGGVDRATVALIGASLRITDRAWLEDGEAVILLPESDRATAEAFAERVRTAAPGRFTARTGIAVFPDDGLTSGALLDAMERGLRGDAMPAPLVRAMVEGIIATEPATGELPTESGVG